MQQALNVTDVSSLSSGAELHYREEKLLSDVKAFLYISSYGNYYIVFNSDMDEVLKRRMFKKVKKRIANGLVKESSIIHC